MSAPTPEPDLEQVMHAADRAEMQVRAAFASLEHIGVVIPPATVDATVVRIRRAVAEMSGLA